ncbi:hypothetical protein P4C99_02715 [Pontiellaceae bacterium B1224]|nr:hypothetical protein [Pontiellaceae bacterium B1224]
MRWIILFFAIATAMSVSAESWTNAAGHSVEAKMIARKGDVLTMKRADGSSFTINMNGLSKKCQSTVKARFPEPKKTHEDIVRERNQLRLEQLDKKTKQ